MVGAVIAEPVKRNRMTFIIHVLGVLAPARGSLLPFMEFAISVAGGEVQKTTFDVGLMITAG